MCEASEGRLSAVLEGLARRWNVLNVSLTCTGQVYFATIVNLATGSGPKFCRRGFRAWRISFGQDLRWGGQQRVCCWGKDVYLLLTSEQERRPSIPVGVPFTEGVHARFFLL